MRMFSPIKDGSQFGHLTIVSYLGGKKYVAHCNLCGGTSSPDHGNMMAGRSLSCGCTRVTHRLSKTITYRSWLAMHQRCYNQQSPDYHHYGGRGIKVCDKWMTFDGFLEDMGIRPSKLFTIDRTNNDGNYEPSNCRWSTRRQQANNRRPCRSFSYNGDTLTIAQWASKLGITHRAMCIRFLNWSIEDAINRPPQRHK